MSFEPCRRQSDNRYRLFAARAFGIGDVALPNRASYQHFTLAVVLPCHSSNLSASAPRQGGHHNLVPGHPLGSPFSHFFPHFQVVQAGLRYMEILLHVFHTFVVDLLYALLVVEQTSYTLVRLPLD